VAARVGFEPATFQTEGTEPRTLLMSYHTHNWYIRGLKIIIVIVESNIVESSLLTDAQSKQIDRLYIISM